MHSPKSPCIATALAVVFFNVMSYLPVRADVHGTYKCMKISAETELNTLARFITTENELYRFSCLKFDIEGGETKGGRRRVLVLQQEDYNKTKQM